MKFKAITLKLWTFKIETTVASLVALWLGIHFAKKKKKRNPLCSAEDTSSIPGPERPNMPRAN